jgi:crossover junction endodeoxyribonuclease RuvC
MLVLGIDPGTATVGYSFVSGTKQQPVVHEYGVLRTLPVSKDLAGERLLEIGRDLEELIQKYKPDKAVIEDLFFFKNQKTVISVAQSRGMMLYVLAGHGIETASVTPLQVKQTLCGYGRASKLQMQKMVQKVFGFEELPKPDDAADSLAMAWWGL